MSVVLWLAGARLSRATTWWRPPGGSRVVTAVPLPNLRPNTIYWASLGIRPREHVLLRRAAAVDLRARPRADRPYPRSPRERGTALRRSGRAVRRAPLGAR